MKTYDVIVIGAGQAGIAMGYALKQQGISFAILDSHSRVGDSWRKRYDSLVLFTPRKYSSLLALPMDGSPEGFPTKDEMANYLEKFVTHFDLPIKLDTYVTEVKKKKSGFEVLTNQGGMEGKQVIIASGAFQKPYIPAVIDIGNTDVFHLHSSSYISSNQLPQGSVLVVGGGNSGTQIADELAQSTEVTLAISHPFKFLPLQLMGKSIFSWLELVGLLYAGVDSLKGKWFRKQSDPIFGYQLKKLITKEEINIKPRVVNIQGKAVTFKDDSKMNFDVIIWSTGFVPSYNWINIEGVTTPSGHPIHQRGISPIQGLYFIGLPWQYQRASALVCGVSRDADYLIPFIMSNS